MAAKNQTRKQEKMKDSREEVSPSLINNANYIKDLSFENPGVLKEIVDPSQGPNLDINIHVDAVSLGEHAFEVSIILNIQARQKDIDLFLIELVYGGIFQVAPDLKEEQRRKLLLIEAPSMLFPFARAIISNLTREGGLPPLLLNPVDFGMMYHQSLNEIKQTKH